MPKIKCPNQAKRIGRNIARLRKVKKWTQSQLGDRLGVGLMQISHYENARHIPDAVMLERMAWVLGVDINEFYKR